MVAPLVGGAILLFSCSSKKPAQEINLQTLITQQSDTLTMINSKNGRKEYRFWTPLMERYEFARDPYMEFRYGINIVTYDSLGGDNSRLRADYAIFYEKRELWETRGNVVGTSADGRQLFTQQLFWDQKTDKVYSNVDCKIVDGTDTFVGEGFESDSEFKEWVFRESEGRMWVDASQGEPTEESPATQEEQRSGADKRGEKLDEKYHPGTVGGTLSPEERRKEEPRSIVEEQEERRRAEREARRERRRPRREVEDGQEVEGKLLPATDRIGGQQNKLSRPNKPLR